MRKIIYVLSFVAIALGFTACLNSNDDYEPYDYAKQLKADSIIIANYIKAKGLEGVVATSSGLNYKISEPGTGSNPTVDSTVTIAYSGILANDKTFGSSDNAVFKLSGLLAGFQEGLPKIKEGGKIKLLIPSGLGYGPYANGSIPANSVLIFDVELKQVDK
ncbi:FKBP-type peptidyl-prolyl cis-trans isomerase [Solitalea sp. MAHUQ-68]|uniref:Peptidyl-prolyl cis-trans isomerase n=1 Tax=Solitalea agri TaxID=2953739 RepID=A0A9X2JCU5_9SPHI|nr:FKBP-type peptidyl-prolyl cis-trans isomerase [Solitalea agri]MCO4293842.1 FKBP-type peptidyl-prolyl cis-trans isomerase [Solitalea agri]